MCGRRSLCGCALIDARPTDNSQKRHSPDQLFQKERIGALELGALEIQFHKKTDADNTSGFLPVLHVLFNTLFNILVDYPVFNL